jgi:guanylate kinase
MNPFIVVIGPSGGGKSSAVRALHDRGVVRVHPTWTTRPRRHDEQNGSLEHRFVSDVVFDELDRIGFFIETVAMFGLRHRYGLPPLPAPKMGRADLVMLRASLVERFRRHAPDCVVYAIEDDPQTTDERVAARGTTCDDVAARIVDNRHEVEAGRALADRVFVNDSSIDDLAARIAAAIAVDTTSVGVTR